MEITNQRVKWYRTPLDKEVLASLNTRSDFKGFLQSMGYLGLLLLTGGSALYGVHHWPVAVVIAIVFLHGTIANFAINGVHELVHQTVFKTKALNEIFVRIFSFIGWLHFESFYASHKRHHQFTLHQPDDQEVMLPIKVLTKQFFEGGFINVKAPLFHIKNNWRVANGRFNEGWEQVCLPDEASRRGPIMWARTLLIGHALIIAVSIYFHLWLLPVLTTLTPCYGSWLFFLCNNTQHIGLQDGVPDYRLCCRTFTLNPFVQFLYWHMNFHIEHHTYAAVPCYNLPALHRAIKHDLPPITHGLVATWKEIADIQTKQVADPEFQYAPPLPQSGAQPA